jgi:hypothetical protein
MSNITPSILGECQAGCAEATLGCGGVAGMAPSRDVH